LIGWVIDRADYKARLDRESKGLELRRSALNGGILNMKIETDHELLEMFPGHCLVRRNSFKEALDSPTTDHVRMHKLK
jgi:hypothetical protein